MQKNLDSKAREKIGEILDRFNQRFKKIDLSLERMVEFMNSIGNPHFDLPPVIHFAGSNGKGSTLAFLRAILGAAGKTCHVYTSPHLVNFNERIVLAGEQITDDTLLEVLQFIDEKSKNHDLTFFEKTTAAAYLAFSQTPADYVLLETGLGGRLDATNILPKKELAIITPISLEHTEFLGNNLVDIAREKAGIIRPGGKVVSAQQVAEVAEFYESYCSEISAELHFANALGELENPYMLGGFQKSNAGAAALAAKLLGIDESAVQQGLKTTKWKGRFEKIISGKFANIGELYIDSAHNPGGAELLAKEIAPKNLVIGMMKSKDHAAFLQEFVGKVENVFTVPVAGEPDSLSAADLAAIANELGFKTQTCENFEQAFEQISQNDNTNGDTKTLVTGSIYLLGNFLRDNEY